MSKEQRAPHDGEKSGGSRSRWRCLFPSKNGESYSQK